MTLPSLFDFAPDERMTITITLDNHRVELVDRTKAEIDDSLKSAWEALWNQAHPEAWGKYISACKEIISQESK